MGPAERHARRGEPGGADPRRGVAGLPEDGDVDPGGAALHGVVHPGQVPGHVGDVAPGRVPRAPGLAVADGAVVRGEGRVAGPLHPGQRGVGEAVHDGLVDAGRVRAAHGAQELLPRGAVRGAGVGAGLAGQHRVARHVPAAGQAAVVVEVLEAQRLALGDVQQRGGPDGVGLQAVRLRAHPQAQGVRPAAQCREVVGVVQVADGVPEVVPYLAGRDGVVRVDLVAAAHRDDGQDGQQRVAVALLEGGGQPGRPGQRLGLDLQGVLEQDAAGALEEAPDLLREQVPLPEAGDGGGAGRAEVVHDVRGGRGVRTALGVCPVPRCQKAVSTQSPPPGAVQATAPSATWAVRSWTLARSRPVSLRVAFSGRSGWPAGPAAAAG